MKKVPHKGNKKSYAIRGGKPLKVTMSKQMFNDLMRKEAHLHNMDELIGYINDTWGLLGTVTEVVVDE